MYIVLLSGGSGKRLWPLSSASHPKQFLKLLKNEQGEYESMVQRVMRQLNTTQPDSNILVSCNAKHAGILFRQLSKVEMIPEPSRRGTFPAITLAAAYLRYKKHLAEKEVFLVCPIDVYAENRYFELLSEVVRLPSQGKSEIGLLGVKPVHPTSKYGYILHKNGQVTDFFEKPDRDEAEKLISNGALWNCGVFALKIGYVLRYAEQYAEFDSFESLYAQYSKLPKISFDYEITEKEHSVATVIYDGVWKDLGTWNTLTEEMRDKSIGENVLISDTCDNTHVLNMLNLPIITQDLKDTVVVASYDGILVSSKSGSSFLKPLADKITIRPMYEQRSWGSYRVLEYNQSKESSLLVKRMQIEKGKSISYQYHIERSEIWIVTSGEGVINIDGVKSAVFPGSVVQISQGTKHSLLAKTHLEFIEVQLGSGVLEEDDIVRL